MKLKWIVVAGIVFGSAFCRNSYAASWKLPYPEGESYVVVQGYDAEPTHIHKDFFAVDFSKNGCDAYGAHIASAENGTAFAVLQEGYNGGYGTEILVRTPEGVIVRYAHLVPESIEVNVGEMIIQGEFLGAVGNTGLTAGAACRAHPGTHLHFALYTIASSGAYLAYKPEPISGYANITEGTWYRSDNIVGNQVALREHDAVRPRAAGVATTTIPSVASHTVFVSSSASVESESSRSLQAGMVYSSDTSSPHVQDSGTSGVQAPVSVAIGGVSIIPPAKNQSVVVSSSSDISEDSGVDQSSASSTVVVISTSTSPLSSSTVSESTSTVVDSATSTSNDASSTGIASSNVTSTDVVGDSIFSQMDHSDESAASWYDDNWYELGNGIGGTLEQLTLLGRVNDQHFANSHIHLQAFKDARYTILVADYPVSDNAPFDTETATTTFGNLSISLKPYFYYRLTTSQDYQNRSIVLAGTVATLHSAMYDEFVYGTGRVEHEYPFIPFILMEGKRPTSTLTPPLLTTPGIPLIQFDALRGTIMLSWSTSTDPDWPENPLGYEINYTTSTDFNTGKWHGYDGPIQVLPGATYMIGVRAADSFGNHSLPATTTWSVPLDYSPYYLTPALSMASQKFMVPSSDVLHSIELFTSDFGSGSKNPEGNWCDLSLIDHFASGTFIVPADNVYNGSGCAGHLTFSFLSSTLELDPDHPYEWVFKAETGNPTTGASVRFYGTAANTAGGFFSDPSVPNAKFIVNGSSGVLFQN